MGGPSAMVFSAGARQQALDRLNGPDEDPNSVFTRILLPKLAVADLELDPEVEARTLIGAAVRKELRQRSGPVDAESIEADRVARLELDALAESDRERALAAAESLLTWLDRRAEERAAGDG